MLTTIFSAGLVGIDAYPVHVEVDISFAQLPKWQTVGLPENEVKESKERVAAAIKNSGYEFSQRKITINLAPADVKKEGTALDLPIALGLLGSSGLILEKNLENYLFVGELSLNGDLKPVRGILPIAILARSKKVRGLVIPIQNASEAAMVEGVNVFAFKNLSQIVEFIEGRATQNPLDIKPFNELEPQFFSDSKNDFHDICGQHQAKRSLEVAASGGHNILFMGSPGAGKTMLASRLPTILPPLSFYESLETSRIYSVLSLLKGDNSLMLNRPFRSPHHSVSDAGLIGGGTYPKPGEVSLSHNGVLFLDELPEFKKNVLELLRQPLESGLVTISRAATTLTFPAKFMLVAAMNPCPCGFLGHPKLPCTCTPQATARYRSKLSGPLLDRIDLQIEVPPVPFDEMTSSKIERETSNTIRNRVMKTRLIQKNRFAEAGLLTNSQMGPQEIRKYCDLKDEGKRILKSIVERFHLSARAFNRILKVSRTIADMEESRLIETTHLLEAVQYRSLDRANF